MDLGDRGEQRTNRKKWGQDCNLLRNKIDRMYCTDRHVSDNTTSMTLKPRQPCYTFKHRGHTWMTCQYISLLSEGCMISFYCICIFFCNKFHRTTDMLVYWWSQNGRLSAHCCFYAVPHYTRHTSAVFVISFHCFALDIATIGSKNINREHIHDAVSHNFLVS